MPDTTMVSNIVLIMPNDIFEQYKVTGLSTNKVIFISPFSSPTGYWIKTKETGNRIFPIWERDAKEVLEWEVCNNQT